METLQILKRSSKRVAKINGFKNKDREIERIYSKLRIVNGVVIYENTSIGNPCDIHNIIVSFFKSGIDTFENYLDPHYQELTQRLEERVEERTEERTEERSEESPPEIHVNPNNLRSLEEPFFEQVFIDETYGKKESKIKNLKKPIQLSDPFECSVCCENRFDKIICDNCHQEFCYQCYCEQCRRTGRCPFCNSSLETESDSI